MKLGKVSNDKRASLSQDQINDDHIEPAILNEVNGVIARFGAYHGGVHPLEMACPNSSQFEIAFYNQCTHLFPKTICGI